MLDMHWYWNQQRSLLNDNWMPSFVGRLLVLLCAVLGTMLLVTKVIYRRKSKPYVCSLMRIFKKWGSMTHQH